MDQAIKQQWIAALESGEYEQTTCSLVNISDNGGYCYCALGVLGVVLGAVPVVAQGGDYAALSYDGELMHSGLNMDAIYKAGLGGVSLAQIVDANDLRRDTFRKIADIVRGTL